MGTIQKCLVSFHPRTEQEKSKDQAYEDMDKYVGPLGYNQKNIRDLLAWIDEQGLGEHIHDIQENTILGNMFVSISEDIISVLLQGPNVKSVHPGLDDTLPVDLV